MKALPAKHIDFGVVSAIAAHYSMIHHRTTVLIAFATGSAAHDGVMLGTSNLSALAGQRPRPNNPHSRLLNNGVAKIRKRRISAFSAYAGFMRAYSAQTETESLGMNARYLAISEA